MLGQDFNDWELIIIDDGSNDNTYDICSSYSKIDKRVLCFKQDNKGVSVARNIGIALSKGDYLVINSTPYLVTGYDWDSTPGVMYVSLDQTYERNMTASPTPTAPATSDSAPYYWMEMK